MGHYCRICGRERPNEQFSGKGHRIHVCKHCQRLPNSQRRTIEDRDDIFGFMQQSEFPRRTWLVWNNWRSRRSYELPALPQLFWR